MGVFLFLETIFNVLCTFAPHNVLNSFMLIFRMYLISGYQELCRRLKGVCQEIFRVLFWHVWKDLGLYKNL
jgi:hypothetical protein